MRVCQRCGTENSRDAEFCSNCQAYLGWQSDTAAETPKDRQPAADAPAQPVQVQPSPNLLPPPAAEAATVVSPPPPRPAATPPPRQAPAAVSVPVDEPAPLFEPNEPPPPVRRPDEPPPSLTVPDLTPPAALRPDGPPSAPAPTPLQPLQPVRPDLSQRDQRPPPGSPPAGPQNAPPTLEPPAASAAAPVRPGVDTPVLPTRHEGKPSGAAPAHLVKEEPSRPQAARAPLRYQMERQRQDPVSVSVIEQAESQEPAGQSAADGQQSLFFALGTDRIEVAPGASGSITATVVNKGSIVEGVDVAVLGVPLEWVRIEPPTINLFVASEATITIRISPPLASTTRPGPVEAEVAVWSVTNPKVRCAQRVHLVVGGYRALESGIEPKVFNTRHRARYTVKVRNRGNRDMTATLAFGDTDRRTRIRGTPASVQVAPGAEASAEVAVTVRRAVTGPQVTRNLPVTLRSDDGSEEQLRVALVQDPLLSKWMARILVAAVVVSVIAGVLLVTRAKKNATHPIADVKGQQFEVAKTKLTTDGFNPTEKQVADAAAVGTVLSQDPAAGVKEKHHTVVVLTVSSGPGQLLLPDLTGKSEADARTALTAQNLQLQEKTAASPTVAVGSVISESPAANTPVTAGQTITLTISSGAPAVKVPDIRGLPEQAAYTELQGLGLLYQTQTVVNAASVGRVVAQNPPAGSSVAAGTAVSVTVAIAGP